MYNLPEQNRPKQPGIIDQFVEKFEKIQGDDFCHSIRSFTVDIVGTEPVVRHLVLESTIWAYETARSPEALEKLVNELNEGKTPPTLNQLKTISRKITQHARYPVPDKGVLSTDGYIQSRKAALLMALCLHVTGCKIPHKCGWNEILKDIKQPPTATLPV